MKNILVTGGAGFIGSAFARYMVHQYPDYNIIVLDKLTYAASPEALDNLLNSVVDSVFARFGVERIGLFPQRSNVEP